MNTFNDIYTVCDKLKQSKKGTLFEIFTKYLFITDYRLRHIVKHVYMYKNIPHKILDKLAFPKNDKGVDLLIVTKDGKYITVQCKYHTEPHNMTYWKDLGTFVGMTFGMAGEVDSGYFVTNAYMCCDEIMKCDGIICFSGNYFESINSFHLDNIKNYIKNKCTLKLKKMCNCKYKKNIINMTEIYYKKNNIGCIQYKHKSEKTYITYNIMKKYEKILIIVPDIVSMYRFYNDLLYNLELNNEVFAMICVGKYDNMINKCDVFRLHHMHSSVEKFMTLPMKKIVICLNKCVDKINKFTFDFTICESDIDKHMLKNTLCNKIVILSISNSEKYKYVCKYNEKNNKEYAHCENKKIYSDIFLMKNNKKNDTYELWFPTFEQLNKWYRDNGKGPSIMSSDENEIDLYRWYVYQRTMYKKKKGLFEHNTDIYDKFKYFEDEMPSEIWKFKFKMFKEWVSKNKNIFPKKSEDEKERNMFSWMKSNLYHVKSTNKSSNLIANMNEWTYYRTSIQQQNWFAKYNELKEYNETAGHAPTKKLNPILYSWFTSQMTLYKGDRMLNMNIKKEWKNYIEKYACFIGGSIKRQWANRLEKIRNAVGDGELLNDIDKKWICRQHKYYNDESDIFEDSSMRSKWKNYCKYNKKIINEITGEDIESSESEEESANSNASLSYENITLGTLKKK